MSDKESPKQAPGPKEQHRVKELREMVREDIEAQHEIVRKLQQKNLQQK